MFQLYLAIKFFWIAAISKQNCLLCSSSNCLLCISGMHMCHQWLRLLYAFVPQVYLEMYFNDGESAIQFQIAISNRWHKQHATQFGSKSWKFLASSLPNATKKTLGNWISATLSGSHHRERQRPKNSMARAHVLATGWQERLLIWFSDTFNSHSMDTWQEVVSARKMGLGQRSASRQCPYHTQGSDKLWGAVRVRYLELFQATSGQIKARSPQNPDHLSKNQIEQNSGPAQRSRSSSLLLALAVLALACSKLLFRALARSSSLLLALPRSSSPLSRSLFLPLFLPRSFLNPSLSFWLFVPCVCRFVCVDLIFALSFLSFPWLSSLSPFVFSLFVSRRFLFLLLCVCFSFRSG